MHALLLFTNDFYTFVLMFFYRTLLFLFLLTFTTSAFGRLALKKNSGIENKFEITEEGQEKEDGQEKEETSIDDEDEKIYHETLKISASYLITDSAFTLKNLNYQPLIYTELLVPPPKF